MKDHLKKYIEQHTQGQRGFRAQAQALRGPQRAEVNLLRRSAKNAGRVLYLAYALLRGVPYTSLERRTLKDLPVEEVAQAAEVSEEVARVWFGQAAHRHAA